jgi:hypothetical protein
MKRIAVCILLGSAMTIGLVGCAEKTKVEKKETVSTPGGSDTKTTTTTESKTGDQKENPPANP